MLKSELNEVHKEVLEMLRIVHNFCVDKNIKYTIAADTLINYNNMHFSECAPIIYIAVRYENFQKIEKYLMDLCANNNYYSIHNFNNTKQFNTLDTWFVKKCNLKNCNSEESFYYGAKLIITPLFFAGKNQTDWLKTYKKYRNVIVSHNVSALLPGKPLISKIKQFPKRFLTRYYIKQREKCSIGEIRNYLIDIQESEYMLYPYVTTKFRIPNMIPWVVEKKSYEIARHIWEDVEIIDFYGVECYCVKNVELVLKCFSDEYIKRARSPKSRLIIEGGDKLRRIQLIQIELLKEFDRICRKNNLRYNISFGTLLGAVRHGGFIPWDDDIDVTMPWEDYNKLDEVIHKELDDEKYYYRTPETEENNHLIFKHLERKGTLYTKPGRNKLKHEIGVFIDIFPMYPAAPNFVMDWFHAKVCRYWRTALWATVGADSEPNKIKRAYYRLISKPGNVKCYQNFLKAAMYYRKEY